jgi:hypothetical protein
MRAVLMFDLDEQEDQMSHLRCAKSLDMALAMWTFVGKLRYIVDASEDGKYIDEDLVWKAWEECLNQYDINLEKLLN